MECARFPRLAPAAASAPAFLRRSGADWRLRRRVRWGRGQARGWDGRLRETESRWQGSIARGWYHFLWLPERVHSQAMRKGHGSPSLSIGPVSFPLAEPRGPALTPAASTCPKMARTRSSVLLPHPSPSYPEPLTCSLLGLSTVSVYTPYIVRAGSSGGLPAGTRGRRGSWPLTHPAPLLRFQVSLGKAVLINPTANPWKRN